MATGEEPENRFRELRTSLEALPAVSEPPKSTLRILGSGRSEQAWNTLLAYFLDPTQPHGFGVDLLKTFLNQVELRTPIDLDYYHRDLEQVEVNTEVTSPQDNRLDIVIRVPETWFVWIESKVKAREGRKQTTRYIEDTHVGREEKSEYPEKGQNYLFLSKEHTPDSVADGFKDLYWRHVVEAFEEPIRSSHGRYPERSISQLREFLSTIISETSMEDDDFTEIQKEKVRLLAEYRDDIDDLLGAADSLRERAIEEWPELFQSQLSDELWTDEWHTRPEYGKWGCIFRDGWYLDDENLHPTLDHVATQGDTGFRLHFVHLIRKKSSFRRGELTYILRSPTNVPLRDEFNNLYNNNDWQDELKPILAERDISNKGQKRDYTSKTYEVDQSRLPESYFDTLATAFEEHLPVAKVADDIVDKALENVRDS